MIIAKPHNNSKNISRRSWSGTLARCLWQIFPKIFHRHVHEHFQAEPIMYTCTVSVTKTISSKELDDLILVDSFNSMATRWDSASSLPSSSYSLLSWYSSSSSSSSSSSCWFFREVEVADGIPDPGAGLPDPFEYFEKVCPCLLSFSCQPAWT